MVVLVKDCVERMVWAGRRLSPELDGQNSPRVEAQAAGLEISSTFGNQRYGSPTSA